MSGRVVLVPGCLALLPAYCSDVDPIPALRRACLDAVGWLGPRVAVHGDEQGVRVGAALLDATGREGAADAADHLVVASGSAMRTAKAPGHLDERAAAFDARLGEALERPDPDALRSLDQHLADALWARTSVTPTLADLIDGGTTEAVDYADDPFGVQYWVIRWRVR